MKLSTKMRLVILLGIILQLGGERAQSAGDIRSSLATSRYALIAQLREIQRNYDDVSRQIDELRRKQDLLDSYRRETESAIAGVDRAMAQAQ